MGVDSMRWRAVCRLLVVIGPAYGITCGGLSHAYPLYLKVIPKSPSPVGAPLRWGPYGGARSLGWSRMDQGLHCLALVIRGCTVLHLCLGGLLA